MSRDRSVTYGGDRVLRHRIICQTCGRDGPWACSVAAARRVARAWGWLVMDSYPPIYVCRRCMQVQRARKGGKP